MSDKWAEVDSSAPNPNAPRRTSTMTNTQTIQDRLIAFLRPLAAGAEVKREYWVSGEDESQSYCYECAVKEKERRQEESPDECIHVCGGYGSEGDSIAFCETCNVCLDTWLTEYGVELELDHYAQNPVCLTSPLDCENLLRAIDNAQDQFTPEQEEQLCQIAAVLGVSTL